VYSITKLFIWRCSSSADIGIAVRSRLELAGLAGMKFPSTIQAIFFVSAASLVAVMCVTMFALR